jgi:hypothetical protein
MAAAAAFCVFRIPNPACRREGMRKIQKRNEVTHLFESISPGERRAAGESIPFPAQTNGCSSSLLFFTQPAQDLSMGMMCKKQKSGTQ